MTRNTDGTAKPDWGPFVWLLGLLIVLVAVGVVAGWLRDAGIDPEVLTFGLIAGGLAVYIWGRET